MARSVLTFTIESEKPIILEKIRESINDLSLFYKQHADFSSEIKELEVLRIDTDGSPIYK